MTTDPDRDEREITRVLQQWVLYRDAGDWERFAGVWASDGFMTATWFQGSATDFIEISRTGFENGVRILHFLGGTAVDVDGDRAIAQTKMTISQRASVHDVDVDVVCTGRFYDFFRRDPEGWRVVRRQPIYEKDRMDPVAPDAALTLDRTLLESFPVGYRHLAYLQSQIGYTIHPALPGLVGPEVETLYREGREWLAGSALPGQALAL
ncbi:nuclear transport factor 2 family protein [Geodermatophilus sabuli]|uniref:Nuclear transport factor 2 family protein n=1 Tax=Geodermatophilus sabuli TaxID=1564158 RepID=A0A7K3W3T7_9ACTN|nr:nuclear transport factor 2 family protein [Geodermatophilus sabuli]NEK59452.1 nuclear transport factor 2 family protein [Geodermatophilus sabuli]